MVAQKLKGQGLGPSLTSAKPVVADALARDDFDRNVWCVFGSAIDVVDGSAARRAIETAARDRRRLYVVTPNVNILCAAATDPAARADIMDADLSLADGAPVVFLARLLGAPLAERCAGSDVFDALRRRPGFPGRRVRVFFFGGREGAAAAAHAAVNAERGGVESVGFLNPGFGDLEDMSTAAVIDEINAADPDFVVAALGAKKGHAWIARNAARLDAPVLCHLGAVVDFAAGGIRRAPSFLSRFGLEWAWRIVQEPALWRRYWKDARTLGRLVATRLLPAMLIRQKRLGAPAVARVSHGAGVTTVSLAGDLTKDDLAPVRTAFRQAAKEASGGGRDVQLDFTDSGAIDPAFLGQTLMLEKTLARAGRRLAVCGVSKWQKRYLNLHAPELALEDLRSSAAASPEPAAEIARLA